MGLNVNTYDGVYAILKHNVANVKFTKVDGTERVMRCTLKDEFLPEQYRGKGTILTEGANTLRVYDLDNGAWRSFRVDSVLEVSVAPSNLIPKAQLLV
jgi:hypothetical protein